MPLLGYDSVTTAALPAVADFYFAYINGRYANYSQVKLRFPHKPVLSIAVSDNADADVLDIEKWDATPEQAPGWVRRQMALGRPKPVLYASQSDMPIVLAAISQAGILRAQVRLWTAHYGHGKHICSPNACGAKGYAADATQWAGYPGGGSPGNFDITCALDNFLTPIPQPVVYQEDDDMPDRLLYSDDPKGGKPHVAIISGVCVAGISTATERMLLQKGVKAETISDADIAKLVKRYS